MTDYTPPVYERTIDNAAPEGYPHEELQINYEISRAKHTADKQITRNHVAEFNGA